MNFILCAGSHNRWYYHIPKQLVTVGGEVILQRTARMIGSGIVVTHDRLIARHARACNCPVYSPEKRDTIIQTILSTRDYWGETNMFYLGDVYFTPDAIKIISYTDGNDLHFFGSKREIFALQLSRDDYNGLKALQSIDDVKLWNLYYYYMYKQVHQNPHIEPSDNPLYTLIEDETQDFDEYEEYVTFSKDRRGVMV